MLPSHDFTSKYKSKRNVSGRQQVRIDIIVIVIGIAVHLDMVVIVIEIAIAITPTVIDGVTILIVVALATASCILINIHRENRYKHRVHQINLTVGAPTTGLSSAKIVSRPWQGTRVPSHLASRFWGHATFDS